MKVFVAGATGALGRQLVPMLAEEGHQVTAMTRTRAKADVIRSMGARPVVANALDPEAVAQVVAEAEPELVIHQLTAIDAGAMGRSIDKMFAQTNRLRTEGTDHLLGAARAVGARRFIAQSFAGWPFERSGGPIKTEDDPLQEHPPKTLSQTLAAISYVERVVTEADGIEGLALRYGGFYGPGTSLAVGPDGEQVETIRKRRWPVVGNGAGILSLVHIHDAAAATAAALDHGEPGVYNVVDDEPAPMSVVIPEIAKVIGAEPPRRIPRWIGRLIAGEGMTIMMTEVRGASNAKAKRELGWVLRYPSWRLGLREGIEQNEREPVGSAA
jgi:nucleoside-diphosphate-sugar epimerase